MSGAEVELFGVYIAGIAGKRGNAAAISPTFGAPGICGTAVARSPTFGRGGIADAIAPTSGTSILGTWGAAGIPRPNGNGGRVAGNSGLGRFAGMAEHTTTRARHEITTLQNMLKSIGHWEVKNKTVLAVYKAESCADHKQKELRTLREEFACLAQTKILELVAG